MQYILAKTFCGHNNHSQNTITIMGMLMSYMGGTGVGVELASQTMTFVTGALYDRFVEKKIEDFDDFQTAILDIFGALNMALPGNHYDAPSHKEIKKFYDEWNKNDAAPTTRTLADNDRPVLMFPPDSHSDAPSHKEAEGEWNEEEKDRKEKFTKFMKENVNISKADEYMMITGVLAPPGAMFAKKAGQSLPQLSVIKSIPDVAFVPTATLLALIAVKLTKRMTFKNLPS